MDCILQFLCRFCLCIRIRYIYFFTTKYKCKWFVYIVYCFKSISSIVYIVGVKDDNVFFSIFLQKIIIISVSFNRPSISAVSTQPFPANVLVETPYFSSNLRPFEATTTPPTTNNATISKKKLNPIRNNVLKTSITASYTILTCCRLFLLPAGSLSMNNKTTVFSFSI